MPVWGQFRFRIKVIVGLGVRLVLVTSDWYR